MCGDNKGRFSVRYENGDHTPREIRGAERIAHKEPKKREAFTPYLGYQMEDFQSKDMTAYYTLDTMEIDSVEKGIITMEEIKVLHNTRNGGFVNDYVAYVFLCSKYRIAEMGRVRK
jgi:hypothetical protein